MNHFFVVAEKAIAKSLGLDLTLRLFLTGIPSILTISIPMAVLLGSLIAVGRISADHEWIALQGAGQGPTRLLKPLLIHGIIWSTLSFLMYSYAVPKANYAMRTIRGEILASANLASDLKPRIFYTGLPDTVLFVEEIRAGTKGRLDNVLLVRSDKANRSTELLLAKHGDLYPAPDGSGALLLDLFDGVGHRYRNDSADDIYHFSPSFAEARERFDPAEYRLGLLKPQQKVNQDLYPRELLKKYLAARENMRQLQLEEGAENRGGRSDRFIAQHALRSVTIEMNQRFALPLASLFFAVLSLPLGITRVRSGQGAGFALSMLVILVYWAVFTFVRDQSFVGKFDPALGPWVANILMVVWTLFAMRKLRRTPKESIGLVARLFSLFTWMLGTPARVLASLRRGPSSRPAASFSAERTGTPLADLGGTETRFVGRLDNYISVYYVRVLLFTILSAYLIYALVESKRLMDGLLRTGEPFSLVLSYFPYFAPGVLYVIMPISCLVGAVVTFTLLTRSGELTAVKASGISMRRVVVPVTVVTLILCALLFLVMDRIAPVTNQKAQAIKDRILGNAPRTYGMPATGRWSFGPQQGRRLYHYELFDPDRSEFQGLSVFTLDRDEPRVLDHRFCERARWIDENWELEGGWYRTFPADGSTGGVTFERTGAIVSLQLDPPENFVSKEISLTSIGDLPEQMSLKELRGQILTLDDSGYDTTQLRVAFHGKLAQALSPLVMVLLGVPFAFKVGKRGSLYGIGVALLLVLVYWAVFAIFNALGLETLLEPWVAAWGPNVLFGLLGVYLMLYVRT
jgi:LPS export ABC transporter permease LptG